MTKSEFIRALSDKLSEQLSTAEVRSQVQYYQGYIDGEMARGKTEQEAVEDLGDPILIARTILESPHETETTIFGDAVVQDEEDAYAEGTYQGENEHSEQEVRHAARNDQPLSDTPKEPAGDSFGEDSEPFFDRAHAGAEEETLNGMKDRAEKTDEKLKEAEEEAGKKIKKAGEEAGEKIKKAGEEAGEKLRKTGGEAGEQMKKAAKAAGEKIHETEEKAAEARRKASLEEQMKRQREAYSGEKESQPDTKPDHSGGFSWNLFALVLVVALIVAAVIWVMTKIVNAIGPALLIIIILVIIVILLLFKNHNQTPRS